MSGTRDRILRTALTLFAERGVDGVSIADITAAVGIAKSSLHSHFRSKEAILEQYKTETALELILEETHRILGLSQLIFERMIETGRIRCCSPALASRDRACRPSRGQRPLSSS